MGYYKIADLAIEVEALGSILGQQLERYRLVGEEAPRCQIINRKKSPIKLEGRVVGRQDYPGYEQRISTVGEGWRGLFIRENGRFRFGRLKDDDGLKEVMYYDEAVYRHSYKASMENMEYINTGFAFSRILLKLGGCTLHAAATALEGACVLFLGPSGVGKSTQSRLWQQYFGKDEAVILNGDHPAIRRSDHQYYVYGTPWCGREFVNTNDRAVLKAGVYLEQAAENSIARVSQGEAFGLLYRQNELFSGTPDQSRQQMDFLIELAEKIPVYKMKCRPDTQAVQLAYKTIWEEK
ncbi:hypothetical protein DW091_02635 [Eubacterium sp. AM05-23]|uniref:hypothetical protein n=1 Tax=Eubacterium TaxID=1730 RepID=UPI000E4B4974|nr:MULTISPECIES: hypothetical protein [Eubacterium]RHO60384.1 hypothetical protein DW091_02635 [Eubacterium sp. AM05-23]